jgi:hypothetical protein
MPLMPLLRSLTYPHRRHAVHKATDGSAKKFAETAEDNRPLAQVGYLELVVEEIGTPARGPLDRAGREVDPWRPDELAPEPYNRVYDQPYGSS